jgi:hypothetical protein
MPSRDGVVSATAAAPGRSEAEPRSVRFLAHELRRYEEEKRGEGEGDAGRCLAASAGGRWTARRRRRVRTEERSGGMARV